MNINFLLGLMLLLFFFLKFSIVRKKTVPILNILLKKIICLIYQNCINEVIISIFIIVIIALKNLIIVSIIRLVKLGLIV